MPATLQPLSALSAEAARRLRGVFCDIDDTLTHEGELVPDAFLALHRLRDAGLHVVPITGRPGGWVDQIARMWPVSGVVGENGGLWFYRKDGRMVRSFAQPADERARNRARLDALAADILARVPGTDLASDQPYRDLDLAIDFCEDVPALPRSEVMRIVEAFEAAGATCKVSSIHVNGWFGHFDKLAGCKAFLQERFGWSLDDETDRWAFVGDSANDEPMFARFPVSVGVANVRDHLELMDAWPSFVTEEVGGHGFASFAQRLLKLRAQA